jgi:hypothetical protein
MTESEHHTEDGEYGFFFRLYDESLALPNFQLFTCLIGRRTSFYQIKHMLLKEKLIGIVANCYFGMLVQGNCRRYTVAWLISADHQKRFYHRRKQ